MTARSIASKLGKALVGLLLLAGAYAGVFSIFASGRSYPLTGLTSRGSGLRGAYHVHSRASDGAGTVEEIAAAARRAGLRFVIFTDHNLTTLPPPRYLDGVLVLHGVELSTPHGHLVSLGLPRPVSPEERQSDALHAVIEKGGWPVLAHPVQTRHPWKDPSSAAQAGGFELYSGDTALRELTDHPWRLFCAAGAYLAHPLHGLYTLIQPDPAIDERWRELSRGGAKPVLCAQDAHGRPPYELMFRAMSTHLPALSALSADPQRAAEQVLAEVREGRSTCAFDGLGSIEGFALGAKPGGNVHVGDHLPLRLPALGDATARVRVVGAARWEARRGEVVITGPGPIRVEIQLLAPGCAFAKTWRPWIVPAPLWALP